MSSSDSITGRGGISVSLLATSFLALLEFVEVTVGVMKCFLFFPLLTKMLIASFELNSSMLSLVVETTRRSCNVSC